ncbi:hypothetical protein OQA88_11812 [Cercophora sp. LCS_1]
MKLLATAAIAAIAALAGLVDASQQSADVFILQSTQSASQQPRLPKEVARHILLQRTSRSRYGSDLRDIPSTIDTETAVEYISAYGKAPSPLFAHTESKDASQLVVILEGVTPETASQLKSALGTPSFTISDPPSAAANTRLMSYFRNLGIASSSQCDIDAAINPFNTHCWTGSSSVVKYDASKSPSIVSSLVSSLPRLTNFVESGDLEVTLLLLPETTRTSKNAHWSTLAAGSSQPNLRRSNDAETVIIDDTLPTKPPTSANTRASVKNPPIPQCFQTQKGCEEATTNCTGHGSCIDKYGATGPDDKKCFVCACKATIVHKKGDAGAKGEKTIHWGGNKCQKEDIAVQFWLLAGFTITIVGAVGFAIGLLYSVGEEKLPGVIGAGVSRSK